MVEIIGFKGFDRNLKCRDFQYEVGVTYFMDINSVKICSSGFHFSENLRQTISFYSSNSSNRFCLVKGYVPDDKIKSWRHSDKVVTHTLEIIKELKPTEVENILKEERASIQIKLSQDEIFRLETVRKIQTAYPNFILGGSSALYLLGFNIKRTHQVTDLDFCIPSYTRLNLNDFTVNDKITEVDQMDDCKNSGNDFDYTNAIVENGDFILMDMKIDPKQKYTIVNYKGFDYKVSDWKVIFEAKMRYINFKNGKKHQNDIMDMLHNPKPLVHIEKEEKQLSFKEKFILDALGEIPKQNVDKGLEGFNGLFNALFNDLPY